MVANGAAYARLVDNKDGRSRFDAVMQSGMKDDDEDDKKILTSDAGEPEVAEAGLKRDEAAKSS